MEVKAELTIPPDLTEAIASRVAELLRPLLTMQKPEPDSVMDKRELAAYLKVSVSTINGLSAEGSLPYFKISFGQSGGVRFKKSQIDTWISRQTIPAVNPIKERMIKTLTFAKA